MSSSNIDSENSSKSEDSDVSSLLDYSIGDEEGDLQETLLRPSKSEESVDSLELMADEDWIKAYEKEREENAKVERMLEDRLNTTTRVDSW